MEHVFLVIHVIIAIALIGMVLLQRSETDGFGLGSGGGSGLLSGRAQANLMTKTTGILAGLFIANSLLLSVLASHHRAPSIVDTIEQQQAKETLAPVVPNAGEDKTVTKTMVVKDNATKETVTTEKSKKVDETIIPSKADGSEAAKTDAPVENSIVPVKKTVVKSVTPAAKPAVKVTKAKPASATEMDDHNDAPSE